MNGIHDMGGMHGFGPIAPEANEPAFHETWEGRMFGLNLAMTRPPGFTIDRSRFLRETMPPVTYLMWSYYEHWYFAAALSLLQAGMVTIDELRTGRAAASRPKRNDAMRPAAVDSTIRTRGNVTRGVDTPPRFSSGQAVAARNINPTGHRDCPASPRKERPGALLRCSRFADLSARGDGECPQHPYTVVFSAREPGAATSHLTIGLSHPWESLP